VAIPSNLLERTLEQIVGFAVGQALALPVEVFTTPLANDLWAADPKRVLDPSTAALAYLRRNGVGFNGVDEVKQSGIDEARFGLILDSLRSPPSTAELLELLRRGVSTHEDVVLGLAALGLDPEWTRAYLELQRVFLSPADAAMARQQGFLSPEESRALAAIGGVQPADADLLFELSGLPYGVDVGLELLRRGKIDEARFAQVVREGHTKTKYTADLLELRYTPLSAAVAAEALIRERVDQQTAVNIAAENGIRETDFLLWSNMLGRPPGITEALTLVNRGEMDHAGFREVVARSDVRTEYADQLLKLRVHYPSLFQMRALISSGAISDEYAREIFAKLGYEPKLIDGMVAAAHTTKTAHHKTISLSILETLYESGLETREWFDKALATLGYDEAERTELEDLLEVRRLVAELTHALGELRSRYVGWKIGRDVVVADLDRLVTDPDVRDRLLRLWDLERETNRPVLSVAQIGQALKYGRFTVQQALDRWTELGLSADDALTHAWIVLRRDPTQTAPAT
jgi:hypothetical protein